MPSQKIIKDLNDEMMAGARLCLASHVYILLQIGYVFKRGVPLFGGCFRS